MRKRNWLWITLAGLLFLVSLLLWLLWLLLDDERLASVIQTQLVESLDSRVELRVERKGFHSFELHDLQIAYGRNDSLPDFLSLDRLGLYARPAELLQRRIQLDSLVLDGGLLQFHWQDSLILPNWMAGEDGQEEATADVQEDPLADALASLGPLAENGFSLDSMMVRVKGLRLQLSGSQQGRALDLTSPVFQFTMKLPALSNSDLRSLSNGRFPPDLLAALLLDWSGNWEEELREAGKGLRPFPLPSDVLKQLKQSGLSLERRRELLQGLQIRAELRSDTLRIGAGLELRPSDLTVLLEEQRLPLAERLDMSFNLNLPLDQEELGVQTDLHLLLDGPGLRLSGELTADLLQVEKGWKLKAEWHQNLDADLVLLEQELSSFGLQGLDGSLKAELQTTLELEADESFSRVQGSCAERLHVHGDTLLWAEMNLRLDSLSILQELTTDFEKGEELSLLEPTLRLRLNGLPRSLDLPYPLGLPEEVDLDLQLAGGNPEDSLRVAADASFLRWRGSRLDLSAVAMLPSLREWQERSEEWLAHPAQFQDLPFSLDLESGVLSADGLHPDLQGSLRLSARMWSEEGLKAWFQLQPRATWNLDPETVSLPGLRVELATRLQDNSFGMPLFPEHAEMKLGLADLEPCQLQFKSDSQHARVNAEWQGARIQELLALAPPELLPAGVRLERGLLNLNTELLLDTLLQIQSLDLALDLSGLDGGYQNWQAVGTVLACSLHANSDSIRYLAKSSLRVLQQLDPRWSWEELSLQAAGRLALPPSAHLLAGADSLIAGKAAPSVHLLEWAAKSLDLEGRLNCWLSDLKPDLPDSLNLQLDFGDRSRILRPWPGIVLKPDLHLEAKWLGNRASGGGHLSGQLDVELDSLRAGDMWLGGLLLELPFRQSLLAVEADSTGMTAHSAFSLLPFVQDDNRAFDWNRLRSWDRHQAQFDSKKNPGEGWNLLLDRAGYQQWELRQLSADLSFAEGLLECPEFRFGLLGGEGRGSFQVHDPMMPQARLSCALIGIDSRRFRFGKSGDAGSGQSREKMNAVLNIEGGGLHPEDWEQIRGRLRMPELDRQVTLNLLKALDAQGIDPSIGRIRRLLELPGFRYGVESVDFQMEHGFVRPRVALRKSPFSPLPDLAIPMSPLPLRFLLKRLELEEGTQP